MAELTRLQFLDSYQWWERRECFYWRKQWEGEGEVEHETIVNKQQSVLCQHDLSLHPKQLANGVRWEPVAAEGRHRSKSYRE